MRPEFGTICSDFPIVYENRIILDGVLLLLLKIVVTLRLDQLVLLNIYFTFGSNIIKLAIFCTVARRGGGGGVYPKQLHVTKTYVVL